MDIRRNPSDTTDCPHLRQVPTAGQTPGPEGPANVPLAHLLEGQVLSRSRRHLPPGFTPSLLRVSLCKMVWAGGMSRPPSDMAVLELCHRSLVSENECLGPKSCPSNPSGGDRVTWGGSCAVGDPPRVWSGFPGHCTRSALLGMLATEGLQPLRQVQSSGRALASWPESPRSLHGGGRLYLGTLLPGFSVLTSGASSPTETVGLSFPAGSDLALHTFISAELGKNVRPPFGC